MQLALHLSSNHATCIALHGALTALGLLCGLQCNYLCNMTTPPDHARLITPDQLIGAATVCSMLGIDRSTMSRRIAAGKLTPLAQLDGPRGAFVFDLSDVQAEDKR